MVDTALKREERQQYVENYRVGLICSIIANVNRDPKRRPNPWMPEDFMPKKVTKTSSLIQTEDQMLQMLQIVHGTFKDGVKKSD